MKAYKLAVSKHMWNLQTYGDYTLIVLQPKLERHSDISLNWHYKCFTDKLIKHVCWKRQQHECELQYRLNPNIQAVYIKIYSVFKDQYYIN